MRTCTDCNGTGFKTISGFTTQEGKVYPERRYGCRTCEGAGTVAAPDEAGIRAAIKGRKPGSLRTARPQDRRAYYVWRMARFHGGVDVTLPVMASLDCGADAYRPELDALADQVAREAFGSDLRGAMRWHRALYG